MSNSTLSTKLASFINGQMTGFLNEISKEYKIDESELLEKWSSYTGLKPKVKKSKRTGPSIIELRQKLKSVGLKTSGKKSDLEERLAAFDRGELKPAVLDRAKAIASGDHSVMTIKMLKEKLKELGRKTSGKKEELLKRLSEPESDNDSKSGSGDDEDSDYTSWTVKKIKDEMKQRGLKGKVGEKKVDLVQRLKEDDHNGMSDRYVSESDCESDSDSDSDCESTDCESDSEDDEPIQKKKKTTKGGSPKVDVEYVE
ncbi:MAG: hypothetical protein CMF96_02930 [Candidatus Marinimicrobia bacterium]|nr:hypothetical protein [Candidatus Neomarinimicrobiota bacterium]|tara:strand:- start:833 stop:1600 length:768 start_codon:yes stop_codon:yes gene_type:complete